MKSTKLFNLKKNLEKLKREIASSQIECLRCGKCCHFLVDGKITPCMYLKKLPNGKTFCTVYKTRLGRKTHETEGHYCNYRLDGKYNFIGCPYNKLTPNNPILF